MIGVAKSPGILKNVKGNVGKNESSLTTKLPNISGIEEAFSSPEKKSKE
jgi:hypothetical protein